MKRLIRTDNHAHGRPDRSGPRELLWRGRAVQRESGRATVAIANSRLGKILVDGKGRTLYDFLPDKSMTSTCYGACAALWPPLTTTEKPIAGHGARASLLSTPKRKDGKLEVTYNHHPLYYFVSDQKPGPTTGQGVNRFGAPWWVISAAGKEIHHG